MRWGCTAGLQHAFPAGWIQVQTMLQTRKIFEVSFM